MAEKTFHCIVTQFDCTEEQAARHGIERDGPILYERYLVPMSQELAANERLADEWRKRGLGWVRLARVIVDIPE